MVPNSPFSYIHYTLCPGIPLSQAVFSHPTRLALVNRMRQKWLCTSFELSTQLLCIFLLSLIPLPLSWVHTRLACWRMRHVWKGAEATVNQLTLADPQTREWAQSRSVQPLSWHLADLRLWTINDDCSLLKLWLLGQCCDSNRQLIHLLPSFFR